MRKEKLLFTSIMFLATNTAFAESEGIISAIKNNGDFKVGVGANYYMMKEKNGEEEKKFSPIVSFGYQYNFKNNFFVSANLNYDVVKLTSKALFSDVEYCDLEDAHEGECINPGAYKAMAEGQKIDFNRFADINVGYNFNNGISLFAGVSFYQIEYTYKNISYVGLNGSSLTDFYELDPVDDGDDSAIGFGIGAYYNIKDTDFSAKLMYNTVSFDGGNLDVGGKQKLTEHQVSLSIVYSFF